ncbi:MULTISPECIES: mannose-6-phosphate isomerase, class I [unclassified Streptomyces]|uniref:mannose-6-phosphate isomerase, class I n=1 Tax=unclassified Streptomyces TaxID=2593676 RepID=UPI0019041DA9|nr:mannose-6-phosphate isomerase, class I [Streptomyces sp. HSG2]
MDRLDNTIRPYAWGSTTAIPDLLGVEPTGEPQAEMWMGAHPGAPSRTARGTLLELIDAAPTRELGPASVARFGPRLPFLLKILSAAAPLSLQVHPDREQARTGYDEEERRGVHVDAPDRNYRDPHHKPELVCALTEFEGLCGFRPPADTADLLDGLGVDSLKPYVDLLHARPEDAALREVLTAVLTADRERMARTVAETEAACDRLGGVYAPYAGIAHHHPGDPGVLAAMLLNHVTLHPGEALYLGAGVPHAYLSGLGVEIMANSDNVLRCGLTPKHVDVPELLRVVRFEPGDPGVLRPEASLGDEEVYETPTDEFRLSRYVLSEGGAAHDLTRPVPQILLCTAGSVRVDGQELTAGGSVFVPAGERTDVSGSGTLFRATVRL